MLAEIGHSHPPFALPDQNGRNATPLDDEVVGDPVLLVFDRNAAGDPEDNRELLRALVGLHGRLNGTVATIFVISRRSIDENSKLAEAENLPYRLLADEDGTVFQAYGIDVAAAPANPASVVLDANSRVVEVFEHLQTTEQMERALACLQELDAKRPRGMLGLHPPVLVVPNVMDREMCQRLIDVFHRPVPLWDGDGMQSAGLDVERGDVKVRNALYGNVVQYVVRDPALSQEIDRKMLRRLVPEMEKAFGYRPARREEYRIAGYDSAEGGSLPAHRDNPTKSTRHRRFTVSVNLNGSEFEGGELAFREFSDHLYDVEEGTAIVWSCSLLHEVMPVTAGRRFILGAHLFG